MPLSNSSGTRSSRSTDVGTPAASGANPSSNCGGSVVAYPLGEAKLEPLRVDFDRRLKLEFHGSDISSDAGLLPYRELDDALGLTKLGGVVLSETRHGKNIRHVLVGLLRQSVFGRLAGYKDVNDAERLSRDPVMRAIVDRKGLERSAASTSQMGRFETEWLATDENLAALTELSGVWIDRVHGRKPPKTIVLDMDSSESPTYGEQEGRAAPRATRPTTGISAAPVITRSLFSISLATWSGAFYVLATFTAPKTGDWFLDQLSSAIAPGTFAATSGATPPLPSRRSTSSWKPKVTHTPSVSRPTRSCKRASPTC